MIVGTVTSRIDTRFRELRPLERTYDSCERRKIGNFGRFAKPTCVDSLRFADLLVFYVQRLSDVCTSLSPFVIRHGNVSDFASLKPETGWLQIHRLLSRIFLE
jgi:hypothetical protein